MKITATYEIEADVEGWAAISNISTEDCEKDILAFLGRLNPVAGQTYLTLQAASIVEEK